MLSTLVPKHTCFPRQASSLAKKRLRLDTEPIVEKESNRLVW